MFCSLYEEVLPRRLTCPPHFFLSSSSKHSRETLSKKTLNNIFFFFLTTPHTSPTEKSPRTLLTHTHYEHKSEHKFDANDFDDREEERWNSAIIYHRRHVFVVFLFSICRGYRSLSSISKSNREWRTTVVWINGPTSFVFLFFVFLESHKGKEHEERTQPAKTKIWEHFKSVGVRGRRPGGGFRHFVNALLDRVVPNSSDTTGGVER